MSSVASHVGRERESWSTSIIALHEHGCATGADAPSVELLESCLRDSTAARDGDRGWIDGVSVVRVSRTSGGTLLHHVAAIPREWKVGRRVAVAYDPEVRDANARLSCAGRLIERLAPLVWRELFPVAIDYRISQCRVAFGGGEAYPEASVFRRELQTLADSHVARNLPVHVARVNDRLQRVTIGEFPPFGSFDEIFPTSLGELGRVEVTNVASFGGRFQVRFRVTAPADCVVEIRRRSQRP